MHYYGAQPVSADYFGRFAIALAKRIGAEAVDPPFVAIMSQGTSGDQMWMDYGQAKKDPGLDAYADAVARFAQQAYQSITYHDWVSLAMAETKLMLSRRVPDERRLAWAKAIVDRMGNREIPNSLPEVYAKEAIILHDEPRRELKLQAIRIGDLGIAAIPNEVFAITGLKIKASSPFETTMNIELANGSEGYIPPPEQHALGGYTTWPARPRDSRFKPSPGLSRPTLSLLEQVAGKRRRVATLPNSRYARSILASKPLAYWRTDEMQGPAAVDSSGHAHHARYEGVVAYHLPGPSVAGLSAGRSLDRSVYLAGGRLQTELESLPDPYSVELWFWSGLPAEARRNSGILFCIDTKASGKSIGVEFGIGEAQVAGNRLFFRESAADGSILAGKAEINHKTWHHVALSIPPAMLPSPRRQRESRDRSLWHHQFQSRGLSGCGSAGGTTANPALKARSTRSLSTTGRWRPMKSPSISARPNALIDADACQRVELSPCDRRIGALRQTVFLVPVVCSLFVLQGLGHERPDGHLHQLECKWHGPADMNFMLIIRKHDVEARSDHLHGITVRRPIHPMDMLPKSMLGRADRSLKIHVGFLEGLSVIECHIHFCHRNDRVQVHS